ncbi:MAG: PDZ domain-containing protein, partial [Betaproteobacteria bacterium]|nr:PDZ domain-containing protein [Betaproteobacteria bacterium]
PADAAGIQPGDVVVSFDGAPVTDAQSLVQAVGRSKPGQQITLGLVRGGRSGNVQVRLGTVPR